MATVTDYLIKIQDLTKQNLDILKTINESFFTNKAHLKTTIAGVDYAIIRATTKSTSNGENGTYLKMDTKFTRNMKNAIAAGIKVGVYVYSYATSVSQAKKEAELVLKYVEPYKLTYPIYFDIEDPSRAKTSLKTENTNMTIAFCDTVKAAGYTPGVYSGASYFTTYLNSP